MAVSNFYRLRENISQTVNNTVTVTINHQQEVAYRLWDVDWYIYGSIELGFLR